MLLACLGMETVQMQMVKKTQIDLSLYIYLILISYFNMKTTGIKDLQSHSVTFCTHTDYTDKVCL